MRRGFHSSAYSGVAACRLRFQGNAPHDIARRALDDRFLAEDLREESLKLGTFHVLRHTSGVAFISLESFTAAHLSPPAAVALSSHALTPCRGITFGAEPNLSLTAMGPGEFDGRFVDAVAENQGRFRTAVYGAE